MFSFVNLVGWEVGLFGRLFGQDVTAFVIRVARMTPDPGELHVVAIAEGEQFGPEVRVQRLIFLISHPAVSLPPPRPPLFYRVDKIL